MKYCLCLVSELMYMYYTVWCICSKYTCIGQFCHCLQGSGFPLREVGRDYVHEAEAAVSGGVLQPRPGIPHHYAAISQGRWGGDQSGGCLQGFPDGSSMLFDLKQIMATEMR